MEIRPAEPDQAAALARIHHREISEGFLRGLGTRFLTLLYSEVIPAADTSCFVAVASGEVLGFICACEETSRSYRQFLRKRFFRASILVLPKVLRPAVLKGILETARQVRSPAPNDLPRAEIISLAVSGNAQGRGLGRLLMQATLDDLRDRKVDAVRVTAGADLKAANALYQSTGFEKWGELEIHAGTVANVYVTDLKARYGH